jgi:hypothetical protein
MASDVGTDSLKVSALRVVALFATATACCVCCSGEPTSLPADHTVSQSASSVGRHDAHSDAAPTGLENRWSDGFLSNGWRDVVAIVGVVGFLLTALGVLLARRSLELAAQQLERTRTANEAATTAAIQALEQSREQYDRHLLNQAHTHLESAKIHVVALQWALAAMRLSLLAETLTHLSVADDRWGIYAERSRKMEDTFNRIAARDIQFTNGLKVKWRTLRDELSAAIAENSTPFARTDQEHAHD